MDAIILDLCTREITELHDFFQGWFTGTLNSDASTFTRFSAVMDPGFAIIGPDGILTDLSTLIDRLQRAYGNYPGTRIWTENHRVQQQGEDWLLCIYEEWQETPAATTARLSSVLFQRDGATPNGLRWLHVHETWLSTN